MTWSASFFLKFHYFQLIKYCKCSDNFQVSGDIRKGDIQKIHRIVLISYLRERRNFKESNISLGNMWTAPLKPLSFVRGLAAVQTPMVVTDRRSEWGDRWSFNQTVHPCPSSRARPPGFVFNARYSRQALLSRNGAEQDFTTFMYVLWITNLSNSHVDIKEDNINTTWIHTLQNLNVLLMRSPSPSHSSFVSTYNVFGSVPWTTKESESIFEGESVHPTNWPFLLNYVCYIIDNLSFFMYKL